MNRKNIILIVLIPIVAIAILSLMVKSAVLPNEHSNGFNRHLLSFPLPIVSQAVMSEPLQEICGAASNNIYFTVPNPQWLISRDIKLEKQDTVFLGLHNIKKIVGAFNTIADSPMVYFFANNTPALSIGHIKEQKMSTVRLSTNVFTRSALISKSSIVLRTLTDDNKKQVFQKVDIHTGSVIVQIDLIQDQQPGGFECDGLLKYDSITKRLFFIEYYRNRFYCLDSNLNLLYYSHTIDTAYNNSVSVQLVHLTEEERFMPATPRVAVSKNCSFGNGFLFIQSALKADNETSSGFRNNAVIDIYQESDGKYKGSFYVPHIKGEKLRSFLIKNNLFIALYNTYAAVYSLPPYILL